MASYDDKPSWLTDDSAGVGATTTTSSNGGNFGNPSWVSDDAASSSVSPTKQEMAARESTAAPSSFSSSSTAAFGTSATPDEGTPTLDDEGTSSFRRQTWCEFIGTTLGRDWRLILVVTLILILSNIPFGWYAVYPFVVFSTWIHETCHGIAAWLVGYNVVKLELFPDGSGLAYYEYQWDRQERQGFVSSAGYQGTAVIGCLLLLIRRTKRGPRLGIFFLALCATLTLIFWIRSAFGIVFMIAFTVLLLLAAWFLSRFWLASLYTVLAVTTSLNAIFAARHLFGNDFEVNGQEFPTDAAAMAELKLGTQGMWAMLWLAFAVTCALLGVLCVIPGPDETPGLSGCYACQRAGCFACCNAPGMRLCGGHFERENNPSSSAADPVV